MIEYDYTSELYHHGVKGMKWGVRRSRSTLSGKVSKLKSKNKNLSDDVLTYTKKARDYDIRSSKISSKNTKWESRLTKSTSKKAKYDLKQQREMGKRNPNIEKIGKYAEKSAQAQKRIMKAQKKIKYNKWSVKSEEVKAAAAKAQKKIEKNDRLINTYSNTLKAMDEGSIKQGKLFMQYRTE